MTITLTDRLAAKHFRPDFNLKSNTFPCSVCGETAFGNTPSNPFIKIRPQKHPCPTQCYTSHAYHLPPVLSLNRSYSVLLYFIPITRVQIHLGSQRCSDTL